MIIRTMVRVHSLSVNIIPQFCHWAFWDPNIFLNLLFYHGVIGVLVWFLFIYLLKCTVIIIYSTPIRVANTFTKFQSLLSFLPFLSPSSVPFPLSFILTLVKSIIRKSSSQISHLFILPWACIEKYLNSPRGGNKWCNTCTCI